MNSNNMESGKKIHRFVSSIALLIAFTALFGVIWFTRINVLMEMRFLGIGNYIMYIVYAVLSILCVNTFKGFNVGGQRISILSMSQAIAMGMTNVLMWVFVVLMSRAKQYTFVFMVYFILITVLQAFAAIAVTYVCTKIYRMIYPPFSMLNIYGPYDNNLVTKMNRRDDKYNITGDASYKTPREELRKMLADYDAVLVNDVPAEYKSDILKLCFECDKRVYFTPKIGDILVKESEEVNLFDTPLYLCRNTGMSLGQEFIKRFGDIVISLVGIILTSPIMLITAILIKAYDGGPVLYKQTRVTKGNKEYKIMKFRSMVTDAEKDGKARMAQAHDSRITPVGRFIRATRIDELPQFFNILKGEMSVVGPRPERPELIEEYCSEVPEFSYRTHVKAGLTGYAQVYGKYNTTSYDKLKLDMIYVQKCSVLLDIQLILMTIRVVFTKDATEGVEEGQISVKMSGKKEE